MSRILKVLYVEDDSDDAQILKSMLQVADPVGFHLSVCRSQRQAIAQLQQESYDLLFVDYWLKQTDHGPSHEILRYVLERSDYLPVMLLTTETRLVDAEFMQYVHSGRIRLLSKSDLSLTDLQELVRSLGDTSYSVLIYDDDADDRLLIEQYLRNISRCQFRIRHAPTEQAALEALADAHFDIMLLDWNVQGRDSRAVIRQCVRDNPGGCVGLVTGTQFPDIPQDVIDLVSRRNLAYLCKKHLDQNRFEEIVMTQLYRTHLYIADKQPELAR